MVGVSPDRVMLIKANVSGGRSVGSGTLVGPALVLTAAHVVFDDGHPATHVEVSGVNAAAVAARLIWPSSYGMAAKDSGQLDAALLAITDPSWLPPQLPALRWGRLTGRRPGVACEATGFPRALIGPERVRDTDQVSAQINPGSRRVLGRYDLTVISAVPTPLRDRPSPWGGLSGAGVFAGGMLVAVVIVDERGGYSGDRLSAVPIYRLVADAGFTTMVSAAGGGLSGPRQLESVELDGVLSPLHRRTSRRADSATRSPAMLLRPEMGVVAFHGRSELTTTLVGWCQHRGLGVGVRLLTGSGGQGKTRLARHLADQLLQLPPAANGRPGWVCGFLNADADEPELDRLADTDAPLLVLVDYAATRSQQLRRLLPLLWDADTSDPVRVLLLARAAGEWWAGLARDLDGEPGEVITLGALDTVQDRAPQFAVAVAAYAERLATMPADVTRAARAVPTPPDIGSERYGSPLTLQLAALTAVLETRQPLTAAAAGGAQTEDTLLRHEERYWIDTAHSVGLDLSPAILRRVVAAATLCGAGSFGDASALAGAVPGIGDLTEDQLHRLDRWLNGLYPPDVGQRWGSLQPDRLGEYLIATTLPEVPGLFGALLTATDAARLHRALTVVGRALGNPALAEPRATELWTQVRDALAADLARLGPTTLQVITETANPQSMLAALHDAAETADQAVLEQLIDALPEFSQSLAELAAQWTTRRVAHLRDQAGAAADPNALTPALAGALGKHCSSLANVGRYEEALAAGTEAVTVWRGLAAAYPDTFTPELAGALTGYAFTLMQLGRYEEALAVSTEAVALYRELAAARPDTFTPELAGALQAHCIWLVQLGRYAEALAASTEAVTIYRELAAARPDTFTPELARALENHSGWLVDLGRYEEALAAGTEAVTIYRELAAARPDTFTPELARSLTNHAFGLTKLGHNAGALAASTEAVTIYRELAAARPDTFTPELAGALENQSDRLADFGRYADAVAGGTEAVTIYRELAAAYPDTSTPDLARSLQSHSMRLTGFRRYPDAVAAGTEAVTIYRELAAAHPDTFTPELAGALRNHSTSLAEYGRYPDALAAGTQAVTIFRQLAAAHPDRFTPNLARALLNQSERLAEYGRYPDALGASTEAVTIFRQLAAAHPDTFTPELAKALRNHSTSLAEHGRYPDALATSTEAVTIYREIAAARPDAVAPDLAKALRNHSERLAALSEYVDALTAVTGALDMFRRLAAQRAVFVPDVARSLVLQGLQHAGLGDFKGAVSADREAVSVYTPLVSVDPDRYQDGYRQAIQSLTQHLKALGRTEQEIADELDRLARGD